MSLAAELHQKHKARLQRIAIAAERNKRDALVEKLREITPEPEHPRRDEWAERQIEKHKGYWFSIVSSKVVVPKPSAPSIKDIQRATCKEFGVTMEALLGKRQSWDIARPRQVSMYLARELTGLSLTAIGIATGDRDHTTAINAVRRVEQLCKADGELASKVDLLRERLS